MDRCNACGFDYGDHRPPTVVDELVDNAGRLVARIDTAASDPSTRTLLNVRPNPETWSAAEYACHVRDVLITQRERLLLALAEERPSFAPMYRDLRVELAGYQRTEPARISVHVEVAAELLAQVCRGFGDVEWARACIYNYPTPSERTFGWMVVHTLHECVHHLSDIDAVLERVASQKTRRRR